MNMSTLIPIKIPFVCIRFISAPTHSPRCTCYIYRLNSLFTLRFSVVHDRQLRGRLADRDDVAADRHHNDGAGDLRDPPNPGRVLLRVEDQASQQARKTGNAVGTVRRAAVVAHVFPAVPHLQGNVAAQQAVHGRVVPQHRRPEPDKLQHEVRAEDAHDHLPGHGAARVHGVPVDNRQLDAQTVREVKK